LLIGLNTIALIVFLAYFTWNDGGDAKSVVQGHLGVFACVGLEIVLLPAIPICYSQSLRVIIVCDFFAALPLAIIAWLIISKKTAATQNDKKFTETYYQDMTQRRTAAAIELNDTTKKTDITIY
jgi:hypothetical protein